MIPDGIGRRELAIGGGLLLAVVLVAIGLSMIPTSGSARDELPRVVEAIRQAELEHHRRYHEYVATDWAPRERFDVDGTPVDWRSSPDFGRLGWRPEEGMQLYGSYRVTLTENDFQVMGVADLDGDGRHTVVIATAEQAAELRSDATAQ